MNAQANPHVRLILIPGRQKSLLNRHPWIFSGAVDKIEGRPAGGDIVPVYDARGNFRGRGFYNPASQIRLRMITFDESELTGDFWRRRLSAAAEFRQKLLGTRTNAFRMINGEADGLPGLIVDNYNSHYVIQVHSLGMERIVGQIVEHLAELFQPEAIYERSDSSARREEGLDPRHKWWLGSEGQSEVAISEDGLEYRVNLPQGQKTGFFLDQRENRRLIAGISADKSLLNCFSYTGGFSLAAAKAGAATVSVEISKEAQQTAREHFRLNGLDPEGHEFIDANVFDYLRTETGPFDVVVLDPPAFVKTRKHLNQGTRAYKDINRLALRKTARNGFLLSCSCSHYVNWDLFQKILFAAAVEAGREVQIVGRYGPSFDHPVNLFFPEGEYLKTFLLRVY